MWRRDRKSWGLFGGHGLGSQLAKAFGARPGEPESYYVVRALAIAAVAIVSAVVAMLLVMM